MRLPRQPGTAQHSTAQHSTAPRRKVARSEAAAPYNAPCRCDQLCRAFQRQIGCNAIHGDKEQRERERVLQEFKDGRQHPTHLPTHATY